MKCAKVRYRDEIGAKIALASTQQKAARSRKVTEKRQETRVYRCPNCGGWHLTSQSRRKGTA